MIRKRLNPGHLSVEPRCLGSEPTNTSQNNGIMIWKQLCPLAIGTKGNLALVWWFDGVRLVSSMLQHVSNYLPGGANIAREIVILTPSFTSCVHNRMKQCFNSFQHSRSLKYLMYQNRTTWETNDFWIKVSIKQLHTITNQWPWEVSMNVTCFTDESYAQIITNQYCKLSRSSRDNS